MTSQFISLFSLKAQNPLNMIINLLELFKIFPYVVVIVVLKLISLYLNPGYSTKLKQSNSIKSTKCQIATKFRNIFIG